MPLIYSAKVAKILYNSDVVRCAKSLLRVRLNQKPKSGPEKWDTVGTDHNIKVPKDEQIPNARKAVPMCWPKVHLPGRIPQSRGAEGHSKVLS